MRTRTVRIVIDEDSDGRKRQAFRTFEAEAILLMKDEVAGYGFLNLLRSMVAELDGAPKINPVIPEGKELEIPETPPSGKKPRGWYQKERAEARKAGAI
jgi:hypothetical protein